VDCNKDRILTGGSMYSRRKSSASLHSIPRSPWSRSVACQCDLKGEIANACIKAKTSAPAYEAEILAFCRERPAACKLPAQSSLR